MRTRRRDAVLAGRRRHVLVGNVHAHEPDHERRQTKHNDRRHDYGDPPGKNNLRHESAARNRGAIADGASRARLLQQLRLRLTSNAQL